MQIYDEVSSVTLLRSPAMILLASANSLSLSETFFFNSSFS